MYKDPEKVKAYSKKWRLEHPERMRELRRRWYVKNRHRKAGYNATYDKKYPEKLKARKKANKKIKITKPCQVCGAVKNIHKHHPDYSKPLEVIYLCAFHHRQLHI